MTHILPIHAVDQNSLIKKLRTQTPFYLFHQHSYLNHAIIAQQKPSLPSHTYTQWNIPVTQQSLNQMFVHGQLAFLLSVALFTNYCWCCCQES